MSTPVPPNRAGLAAALSARLTRRFADRLPARVAQIADALAAAERGDAGALERASDLAHQLHGTAGSYGFTRVSAAVAQLEALLRERGARAPVVAEAMEATLRAARVEIEEVGRRGDAVVAELD